MSAGLHVDRLSLGFRHEDEWATAVKDCHLQLRAGEILGLLGESGSGKSLTALACLGLTPPGCQVRGSIRLDGEELVGADEPSLARLRGRRIAMIFQNPMTALNPYFSIGQQMTGVICQHFPQPWQAARQEATAALQRAGLTEAALARYPHQMSGGQLQRVMIAMAISCRPKFLIADEPTTALDVTVQARILNLLRSLAEHGMGILLISHDLGVVAQVADRVAVMYCGSIVESGSMEQVLSGSGHPYTLGLRRSSPSLGMGRRVMNSIPGLIPDYRSRPAGCAFQDRCQQVQDVCRIGEVPQLSLPNKHLTRCHFPLATSTAVAAS